MENLPLDVQRMILAGNVEAISEGFPSSKKAKAEKEARSALDAFDNAHPEILAKEESKRAVKEAKKRDEAMSKIFSI